MMIRSLPDTHTFTSAAEMREHYAAVRKRIYGISQKQKIECIDKSSRSIPFDIIISLVADFYLVSLADIISGKTSVLVRIRYITMYLACRVGKKPLRHVCKIMRVHFNTVYDGIKKIQERRHHDAVLNSELDALTARIEQLPRK